MSTTSYLQSLVLRYFSKPRADRPVYRAVDRLRAQKMLELGLADCQRAMRMIAMAARFHSPAQIEYAGLDRFEGRTSADGPGVTLKMAHRLLKPTGARIRLIPGDPLSGLSMMANTIGQVDLMLISARWQQASMEQAWFYVPRMLHESSLVLREKMLSAGQCIVEPIPRDEVNRLAALARPARRVA